MCLQGLYQITHPQHDNKELEDFIITTERGGRYLNSLQTVESDMPYTLLKQVFDNKKGNVVNFPSI